MKCSGCQRKGYWAFCHPPFLLQMRPSPLKLGYRIHPPAERQPASLDGLIGPRRKYGSQLMEDGPGFVGLNLGQGLQSTFGVLLARTSCCLREHCDGRGSSGFGEIKASNLDIRQLQHVHMWLSNASLPGPNTHHHRCTPWTVGFIHVLF